MITATQKDINRFMSYVDKLPNGCWIWLGARSRGAGKRKWYGKFRVNNRAVAAHRFAAEVLGSKECPPGHHRDHLCRCSLCVNPDHIEVVSAEENRRRMLSGEVRAPAIDANDPIALALALQRLGCVEDIEMEDGNFNLHSFQHINLDGKQP